MRVAIRYDKSTHEFARHLQVHVVFYVFYVETMWYSLIMGATLQYFIIKHKPGYYILLFAATHGNQWTSATHKGTVMRRKVFVISHRQTRMLDYTDHLK